MSIDLTAAPFNLDAAAVAWVNETLAGLSADEKLGQLFCLLAYSAEPDYLDNLTGARKVGGLMLRPMPRDEATAAIVRLQTSTKIPMLIAGNLEAGSAPTVDGGTFFGTNMALGATGDASFAARAGEIIGREGKAAGVNWAFAPVCDLDLNHRNPITGTRCFGSDTEHVAAMTEAWVRAVEGQGVATSTKHFPGDGVDERDQHLVLSVNDLSTQKWDATYGEVYRRAIAAGTKTIMAGHISQPAYSKHFRPELGDAQCLPATLAPELLGDLLRGKLGFNGLIVSDATSMIGMTVSMPRSEAVPRVIASGCDMFLFTKNLDEDFAYMQAGIDNGTITPERLDEAVTRVLALKASLGLHTSNNLPHPDADQIIANDEAKAFQAEVAQRAITLVKNEENLLPITPAKYKRVLVYRLELDVPAYQQTTKDSGLDDLIGRLQAEGFGVTTWVQDVEGFEGFMVSAEEMKRDYDLILYLANLPVKSNQTVVRIEWALPMGVNAPAFINEVPTVFVSLQSPYHLIDVPQIRTFINTHGSSPAQQEALLDAMTGRTEFLGRSPVDPFVGRIDTRLGAAK